MKGIAAWEYRGSNLIDYLKIIGFELLILCCGAGHAAATDRDEEWIELRAQIQALQNEVAELRGELRGGGAAVPDERLPAPGPSLGPEVLPGQAPPASVILPAPPAPSPTAGYDGGFFVSAPDGKFYIKAFGFLQTRYIWNESEQAHDRHETTSGFVVRRSEVYLAGHIFDPSTFFMVAGGFDRSSGDFGIVASYVGQRWGDSWAGRLGVYYAPFLIEQLISTSKQQFIERSYLHQLFTVGTSEGAELACNEEHWRTAVMLNDGTWQNHTEFDEDWVDFGISARGELLLAGDWEEFSDFEGWCRNEFGINLGGAIDYEHPGDEAPYDEDISKYSLDLSVKNAGWNTFIVLVGRHFGVSGVPETVSQFGVQVQGGLFLVPDKLELVGRYEHVELDGWRSPLLAAAHSQIDIYTAGFNWFFHEHNLKFMFDVTYLPDGIDWGDRGSGLVAAEGEQFAVRSAVHMRF